MSREEPPGLKWPKTIEATCQVLTSYVYQKILQLILSDSAQSTSEYLLLNTYCVYDVFGVCFSWLLLKEKTQHISYK